MTRQLAIGVISLLISCNRDLGHDNTIEISAPVLEVASVKTTVSQLTEFDYLIVGNGKIVPKRYERVHADIDGVVLICNAMNGKSVKKGDLIVSFFKEALDIRLQRAEVNLYKASLEFQSQLMGYSFAPENIPDSVKYLLRASSGLAFAELDLREARMLLANAAIYAPFDGVLTDVAVRDDYFMKAGDELFSIYSATDLYVDVKVLETDVNKIEMGQKAQVLAIAGQDLDYTGVVSSINPRVDQGGMVDVSIKLLRYDGLLPGMNVRASIFAPYKRCVVVPKEAIVVRDDKPVIFTLDGNVAKWNYVVTGRDNGIMVEVKEGLSPGEKVIISHNTQLSHNALVKEDVE